MTPVPSSLRKWFLVHFFANGLAGVQLLFAPVWFLTTLGFTVVDPIASRLVGAALLGIGVASLMVKNKGITEYKTMVLVKALWSGIAILGLAISLVEGGVPQATWLLLGVFVAFHFVWEYYLYRLK